MQNLLRADEIKAAIASDLWALIPALHIVNRIDSTNTYVLHQAKRGMKSGFICLAEEQTAGRGRLDRSWFSPGQRNIYLSMLWQFTNTATSLAGLSLVIGLVIVKALKQLGIKENLGLKWPNDVYWQNSKLAGVLVEMETANFINAVIGIGLNVAMPDEEGATITQAWTDLNRILGLAPDRNLIAGLMTTELLCTLPRFAEQGLAPFLAEWQALDIYYSRPLSLQSGQTQYSGIARGVNAEGELILQCDDGVIRSFASAEILSAHLNK